MSVIEKPLLESLPRLAQAVTPGERRKLIPSDAVGFQQGENSREIFRPANAQGDNGQVVRSDDAKFHALEVGRLGLRQGLLR